jgi:hypothetical protein
MAGEQWTPETVKRVTFVTLLEITSGDYDAALDHLARMEEDNFFQEARPTPAPSTGRSAPSRRQASSTPSPTRGRDQRGGNGGYSGNMRDPDGPPTDKQVDAVLKMTSDYTEDDHYSMTKQEVSDLISDLKG